MNNIYKAEFKDPLFGQTAYGAALENQDGLKITVLVGDEKIEYWISGHAFNHGLSTEERLVCAAETRRAQEKGKVLFWHRYSECLIDDKRVERRVISIVGNTQHAKIRTTKISHISHT